MKHIINKAYKITIKDTGKSFAFYSAGDIILNGHYILNSEDPVLPYINDNFDELKNPDNWQMLIDFIEDCGHLEIEEFADFEELCKSEQI